MARRKQPVLQEIQSVDEIPAFTSEDEEAEYWATHSFGPEILEQMGPLPDGILPEAPRTRPVAVQFDADVLRRLKAVAAKKHKGYQTLLKEFIIERLYEEEKREGLS